MAWQAGDFKNNLNMAVDSLSGSALNNAAVVDPNADGIPGFDIILWFKNNWQLAILGAIALLVLIRR